MEGQVDDQMFLSSVISNPSPFQPQTPNHFNFGGIRHGFNNPNSNRRHPYPPPTHGFKTPTNLPPLASFLATGFSTGPAPRAPMYPINIPNSGMRRIQSLEDNARMLTPPPSRRTSEMHGVERTVKESEVSTGFCECSDNTTIVGHETPNIQMATTAYNRMQPYARVSVSQLLNTPVDLSSLPSMASPCPGDTPDASANTSSTQRRQSPVSMSICSDTTNSSITIGPSLDIVGERCFLLTTLYQTCQTATADYVCSLPPLNRRARAVPRYHPYATSGRRYNGRAKKEGKRSNATLMDSIARICTRIWRKARRDLVAPHREEAGAVKEMRDLYKWSEVVARCMESDGLDEGDVSGTEGGRNDGLGFPGMKVAKAAKKICHWLGDEEAFNDCDTIMAELRELGEHDEMGRLADPDRGGGSEYGSIL